MMILCVAQLFDPFIPSQTFRLEGGAKAVFRSHALMNLLSYQRSSCHRSSHSLLILLGYEPRLLLASLRSLSARTGASQGVSPVQECARVAWTEFGIKWKVASAVAVKIPIQYLRIL